MFLCEVRRISNFQDH
uniref:Uncharacterized protein n=1 Tax=Rhizophora mucronata TaxID=61149 RepID=A0A2P2ILD2_RHIMU